MAVFAACVFYALAGMAVLAGWLFDVPLLKSIAPTNEPPGAVVLMKEEVNTLCRELGREPEYPPVWREEP